MKKIKIFFVAFLILSSVAAIFWVSQVGVAQEPEPKDIPIETLGMSSPTASYTVTLGAWRNMRPTESYLRRISMLPPDVEINCVAGDQKSKGWIVGDSGIILGYCNGVWEQFIGVESIPTALYDVQALDHDLAIAVGDDGTILQFLYDQVADDWVWTKSPIPVGNQRLLGVSMVWDETTEKYWGWAVGTANSSGKGVLIQGILTPAEKNGQNSYDYTWTNQTSLYSLPNVDYYHDVVMLSKNNGWAVGGDDGVYGTIIHWNGSQWSVYQQLGTKIFRAIHMLSPTDGWAVGVGGIIYHYNGSSWSSVASPTSINLTSVGVDADGQLWITGLAGVILKYANGNWVLWNDLRTDPFDFRDLDFNSGHGWLIAQNTASGIQVGGQILEFDEKDKAWVSVTTATDNRLNAVSNVSENEAWAVGNYDSLGGTIIHWDGKHWQRWYQKDVPLPKVNLYSIDMLSKNDGWAAGDPKVTNGPAVFLHWDGRRWAEISYNAPVNVRVNSIALFYSELLGRDFGWGVANHGNAVARWDKLSGYWMAPHTCQGIFYNLRSVSIVPKDGYEYGDAWAVGEDEYSPPVEHFVRYMDGCAEGAAWDHYYSPIAPEANTYDGPTATDLYGISMQHDDAIGTWGYAVGNYKDRACIYSYTDATGQWSIVWCEATNSDNKPSRYYATDIVEDSGVGWFAGFYDPTTANSKKRVYISYLDHSGLHWVYPGMIFPINGVGFYHRPILSLDMASDTMGWAVGSNKDDVSDNKNLSVIYQYPYPNFTLDIDPPTQVVKPGNSTMYTVTVNSIGGFDADVSLEILRTPTGVSSTINPTSTNSESSAFVTLDTLGTTSVGRYSIPLLGYATFLSGDHIIPVWRTFPLNLIVTNNPIYSIVPSHAPYGVPVTINGEGFGPDPGVGNRSSSNNNVYWAGEKLEDADVLSWSDTQITFLPPDNPSKYWPERFPLIGNVMITAGGEDSNDNLTFQLENYITGAEAIYGSGVITGTIFGTSFGLDPGETLRSTYYEHINLGTNWVNTANVLSWSNNVITFTTTSFAPVTMTVTSNGFSSNSIMFPSGGSQAFLPLAIR